MTYKLDKIIIEGSKSIREVVLQTLRSAIFENLLSPGERLVENTLAESLGVSRTPVREAIRQLELEGLVVNTPRKGTVVSEISIKDALEMYDIREVLEGLAVRLACDNLPRKQIKELKNIISEMENYIIDNNINGVFEMNSRWNKIILQYSENIILEKNMKEIYEHLSRLRKISLNKKNYQINVVEEYKLILRKIENNDIEGAENAAKEHVRKAKSRFSAAISK